MKNIYFTLAFLIGLGLNACKKQESSEEKMLRILEETKATAHNYKNSFCTDAKIAFIDSILNITSKTDVQLYVPGLYEKANVLLQMGQPEKAASILEELSKDKRIPESFMKHVRNSLALAHLRNGEQSNCITNHGKEMCVFPIKNGGIHTIINGSKQAIKQYEEILSKNPEDNESRWLLNIAYMTLGRYPDDVPKAFLIPNLGMHDDVQVKPFQDMAMDLGLDANDQAGGVILDDFDNDGYIDIVTSSWDITRDHMHYFKNNGNGTFIDLSEKSRLSKFSGGLNIVQTDYNNDGFKDIFVPRGAWLVGIYGEQPNSLLRNNGDGTFTDVTIDAGLLSFHPTQAVTWNDFNNDGWLDLFIGNETGGMKEHPCELYMNNKNGTFTEVAAKAHCNIITFVKGVNSGDFDNDGLKDIFISSLLGNSVLLKNKGIKNGTISFEDVTVKAGLADEHHGTFSTWFWDYDNDGWLDIFVADYTIRKSLAVYAAAENLGTPEKFTGQPFLYHNNHDGTFTNVTKAANLNKTAFAMGSNFGDIDNDGFLDMYLGTGNPLYESLVPNKMFKNMGNGKFADVTTSAQVGSLQKGHGVAFADMDNDGDQDIYIEMGGAYIGDAYPNSFFQNPGQSDNNWLSLNLVGTKSNKAAIGTKLKVTFKDNGVTRSIYRDVNSGSSFGSSPLKRELGVGHAKTIDEIEIKWHGSGLVQTFKNVPVNQTLKITEGKNALEKVILKTFVFKKKTGHKMPECKPTMAAL